MPHKDFSSSEAPIAYRFDDPRLGMSLTGRFVVRVVIYIAYLLLIAVTLTLLVADLSTTRWLGIGLALFLIDRLLHRAHADRSLRTVPRSGRVDLAAYHTPRALRALERTVDRTVLARSMFPLELATHLLSFAEIREGLVRLDVPVKEFRAKIEEFLATDRAASQSSQTPVPDSVAAIAQTAYAAAVQFRHAEVDIEDLFIALADFPHEGTRRLFGLFGMEPDAVAKALLFGRAGRRNWLTRHAGQGHIRLKHRIMNRAWTSRPTPGLDSHSTDLTDLAREGFVGYMVGHAAEFEHLLDTLSRPINPHALLIGEPGSGKDTLVEHLALRMIEDRVPKALFDKRIVKLDIASVVARAEGGNVAGEIKKVAEEIVIAGNVILYIPDLHNITKTANAAFLSAADALLPIITDQSFPVIGATFPREFKMFLETRTDLTGSFELIRMQEIADEEAEELLVYESLSLEREHSVVISFGAIRQAVRLAKQYLHDRPLPLGASELLKEAVVHAERNHLSAVGPDAVIAAAESKTNIPIHATTEAEATDLLSLEERMHEQFVDQDEAVAAVAKALREYRSGLVRKGGPIASFLFVGPTGVGKTELAKVIARLQFGSEDAIVRFDMSEHQDAKDLSRFIGAPSGGRTAALTDLVRAKPFSAILLDEFEKAPREIGNLFLRVLDEGVMVDALERTVDFKNTIIIATSNAHSDIVMDALRHGESVGSVSEYLKQRLVDVFPPELLNRFSAIVVFKNLEIPQLTSIATLQMQTLVAQLADRNITLTIDAAVPEFLARKGFEPAFGARPLRGVIENLVRAPLAEALLARQFGEGDRVTLAVDGAALSFIKQ